MSRTHFRTSLVFLPLLAGLLVWPADAGAQRRDPGRRGPVRPVVIVGGYRPAPYWLYDPWYQWGPYPYPYPPIGYRYGLRDTLTTALRLEVTPRQAEVFVDGYRAGTVDDFDGVLQRLRLPPGAHELVLYLPGYETVRQSLYLNPGADQKIRYTLQALRPGQISEPPPPPEVDDAGAGPAPGRPAPPRGPRPGPQGPPPTAGSSRTDAFGALSLRVQPGDAEIFVDGERWSAPAGQDRIVIQLSEGRHHVEVGKEGFNRYVEDVLVRRGSTLTLNVSLLRGGGS